MSTAGSPGGSAPNLRRPNYWSLVVLILAVAGMAFAIGPTSPLHASAPTTLSHATPQALGWAPLTINTFTALPNPAFVSNTTTVNLTVSGGLAPYTYSYSGAPTGCTPTTTSQWSCVPTTAGNYTVVVTVSDSGGNVTKNVLPIRVQGFTITTFTVASSPDALGNPVTFASTYAGESGTVTWSWSGLPAGCTAPAAAKTLTCTPTAPGSSTVVLTGVDSALATNARSVALTVTPVSVTGFTESPSTLYTGQTATFTTTITGALASTVTYSQSDNLVTGSYPTLWGCPSTNSASFSCTPEVPGTYTVTVTAKDSAGDISTRTSAQFTVKPLTITSLVVSPLPVFTGVRSTITVTAFGNEGVATYSYAGLPAGCLSQNLAALPCTPSSTAAEQSYTVVATVSDPTGNTTSSLTTFTVNPAAQPALYVPYNTTFSDLPASQELCQSTNNSPFFSNICYSQSQDPSVVTIPTGTPGQTNTGVGYSVYTDVTNSTCAGASAGTNSRVVFAVSPNNGTTFTSHVFLGPTACPGGVGYLNAIEPSFASNGQGQIFGAFIEESSGQYAAQYVSRAGDALGFVWSNSGGVSFSAVTTLDSSGNLARPAIAVYGQTIYIVYENIANTTTAMPGGSLPISIKMIWSSNGGQTWSAMSSNGGLLRGMNASSGYNAMSPSIAVSPGPTGSGGGRVAVAYATDRSCIANASLPTRCLHYGENIVVATSTTNGTTWTGPSVVTLNSPTGFKATSGAAIYGNYVGETTCQTGACQSALFEGLPSTSVAYSTMAGTTGEKLFVAWSGVVNASNYPNQNFWWRYSGLGVDGSANQGTSWSGGYLVGPDPGALAGGGNRSNYYSPTILAGSGSYANQLYVTYSEDNETNVTSGVGKSYPGPFDNAYSQWADNATVSAVASSGAFVWWTAAPEGYLAIPAGRLTNVTGSSNSGTESAIGLSATGTPIDVFSQLKIPISTIVSRIGYYAANTTYGTNLTISAPAVAGTPQVVTLTFSAGGLSPGARWGFTIDGQQVVTTAAFIEVLNVPKGYAVFPKTIPITALGAASSYGEVISSSGSYPVSAIYNAPATLALNFSVYVYFNQSFEPGISSISLSPGASSSGTYELETYGEYIQYLCTNVSGRQCLTPSAYSFPGCSSPSCTSPATSYCSLSQSDLGCALWEIEEFQLIECYSSYPCYPPGSGQTSNPYLENETFVITEGYCGTGPNWANCVNTAGQSGVGGLYEYEYEVYSYGPAASETCYMYVYGTGPSGWPGVPIAPAGSGSITASTSCPYGVVPQGSPYPYLSGKPFPMIVPLGFKVTYNDEVYIYNSATPGFPTNIPTYPSYANGTGAGGYTGAMNECGSGGAWNQAPLPGGIANKTCPEVFYSYYYYAYYYTSGSWPTGTSYCYQNYYLFCVGPPRPYALNGPTNETTWNIPTITPGGGGSTYPVDVFPRGLASGTKYYFTLNGVGYSATAPSGVLTALPVGTWPVTNAYANGSSPGWKIYPTPVSVNVPAQVIVNLYFNGSANLAASPETLTITEKNLSTGITWGIDLNGTTYEATTGAGGAGTSIAVANMHPGNYSLSSWNVTSTDGGTNYHPTTSGTVSFISTATATMAFTPSYRLTVIGTTGGTVTVGSGKPGNFNAFEKAGASVTLTATPGVGYDFAGWTGTGTGSYSGVGTASGTSYQTTVTMSGAITESATFVLQALAHYNLTFTTVDLPVGVWWTVMLNDGQGPMSYSTNQSTLTVPNVYPLSQPGGLGIYALTVATAYANGTNATRYVPSYTSSVDTTGAVSSWPITWTEEYEVTVGGTPGGSVSATIASVAEPAGSYWVGNNTTISATAIPSTVGAVKYAFTGFSGSGPGSVSSPSGTYSLVAQTITFTPTGPMWEEATFTVVVPPVPRAYNMEFTVAAGLFAPGTTWTVSVGGKNFTSTGSALNATGFVNGTYGVVVEPAYSPSGLTRYQPSSPPPTETVAGKNLTGGSGLPAVRLSFTVEDYVVIDASSGGTVTATQGSNNGAAPLPGWYNQGTTITMTATASGTNLFVSWNGTVNSSSPVQALTVKGPVSEIAEFQPAPPVAKTQGGFFAQPSTWGIFAGVGLVAGLGAGILVAGMMGRRRRPPASSEDREGSEPSVSEMTEEVGTTGAAESEPAAWEEEQMPMDEEGGTMNPGGDQ